jgi:hypothetical protein
MGVVQRKNDRETSLSEKIVLVREIDAHCELSNMVVFFTVSSCDLTQSFKISGGIQGIALF